MSIKVDFSFLDPATKPYKKLTVLDKTSLIADSLLAKPCKHCEDMFIAKMPPQCEIRCTYCGSSMRQRWQVERHMQNTVRPYIASVKNEPWYKLIAKRLQDTI